MQPFLNEIVKYVIFKTREEGMPVTEAMAAFLAQTCVKKGDKIRFYYEDQIHETHVQHIKNQAIQKLMSSSQNLLQTIELQIYQDNMYYDHEYQKQDKIKQQSLMTGQMIDQVVNLDIKNSKDFDGIAKLYKKIFQFLLYKNKELILDADSINQIATFNIEKEVSAALESVIPRAALGPFVYLNPSEKVTQLVELSNLVIGIRLFNKELGKGGSNLISVQDLVDNETRQIPDLVQNQCLETAEICEQYSLFFEHYEKFGFEIKEEQLKAYKEQLTFLRQYFTYMLGIQEDVEVSENIIQQNEQRYLKEIQELKVLLGNKSSAPKEQVYPKFAILAQAYNLLLTERQVSEDRMSLFRLLNDQRQKYTLSLSVELINHAIEIQNEKLNNPVKQVQLQIDFSHDVYIIMPNSTPEFINTPLDYLGFCLYTIVQKDGLLIPGKPELGVYRYLDKFCVFSERWQIIEFLKNPNEFLDGVMNQCRLHPELIKLLRLEELFPSLLLSSVQIKEGNHELSTKLLIDKDCETPTHFVEKNIENNYYWNEWELRKKAIQMANIRKKMTKASQTIISNFKTDSDAQVWLLKDQSTNTGVNKGVNPIKLRNYNVGLRDKNTQL